jgi:phosphatidate cytidylyltransferase
MTCGQAVISAVVMVAVGRAEIWLGGPSFAVLVILMCAAMVWELAHDDGPRPAQHAA